MIYNRKKFTVVTLDLYKQMNRIIASITRN